MTNLVETIRQIHPAAEARYNPPVIDSPDEHVRDGHWAIYDKRNFGEQPLGIGDTEHEAWENAVVKLGLPVV